MKGWLNKPPPHRGEEQGSRNIRRRYPGAMVLLLISLIPLSTTQAQGNYVSSNEDMAVEMVSTNFTNSSSLCLSISRFRGLQEIRPMNDSDAPLLCVTSVGTHQSGPAESPAGREVAFSSDNHTEVMGPVEDNLVGISERPPMWSLIDGGFMFFVSNVTGDDDIWRVRNQMDVLGCAQPNLTQVTEDDSSAVDQAWSPEGTALAFALDRGGGTDLREAAPVRAVRIYVDIDPEIDPKIINAKGTGVMDGIITGEGNTTEDGPAMNTTWRGTGSWTWSCSSVLRQAWSEDETTSK